MYVLGQLFPFSTPCPDFADLATMIPGNINGSISVIFVKCIPGKHRMDMRHVRLQYPFLQNISFFYTGREISIRKSELSVYGINNLHVVFLTYE